MSNAKSTHHSKAVRGHHLGDRIVVPCRTHTKAGGFGDLSQERTLLPEKLRAAGLLFHSALAVGRWACEWGHQSSEAHVITKKQFFFSCVTVIQLSYSMFYFYESSIVLKTPVE